MATMDPTPPPETTLHPDDGTLLTALSFTCASCDAKMLRVDKEILADALRPQSRYTYSCNDCSCRVFVDVPHIRKG